MTSGTPYAGGLFVANYFVSEQPFALIVSPRDTGDLDPRPWGKATANVATDFLDGFANTDAMVAAGSKLAKDIRALRIGDHDDWYLPSRLESLLLFGSLAGDLQKTWYWTSTQYAGDDEYAWIQLFTNGNQYGYHREASRSRARAVRRVPIR